jgi:hypothetical protein
VERIEPTRQLAAKIWWAFAWRALLLVVGAGFLLGLALGLIGFALKTSQESMANVSGFLGLLIGVGASIEVMYRLLNKRFKTFQLVVVSPDEEQPQA